MRILYPMSLVLTAAALLLASVAFEAQAADFYQWTDRDGVVNYTDDAKQIPPAYKTEAVERSFEELKDKAHETRTVVTPTPHVPAPVLVVENPNRANRCLGVVTVNKVRRQVGAYNRSFYIVTDDCGNVLYDSPVSRIIRLQVNR